jgi:hypothetical protein
MISKGVDSDFIFEHDLAKTDKVAHSSMVGYQTPPKKVYLPWATLLALVVLPPTATIQGTV